MLGITLANDAHHAIALDDLAMLADGLHACPNFHRDSRNRSKKLRGRPEQ
jgi:hypothetical protein